MPRYENNQNRSYYIFNRVSYSIRRKPHGRKSIHVIGGKENLRATFNFSMLLVDAIILGSLGQSLSDRNEGPGEDQENVKNIPMVWAWLKSTNGKPIKIGFLYGLVSKKCWHK